MSKRKKPTKEELLAMQQPSTRALLTDDLEESKAYFQGLSANMVVTQEDMDSGKVAKPKEMSNLEIIIADTHRKRRAGTQYQEGYMTRLWNSLGEFYKDPDVKHNQEAIDRAVDAFMKTPGTSPPNFEGLFAKAANKAKGIFKIRRKSDKVRK